MRIVALNQDAGIDPGRAKGAAVHLQAMRAAFDALGHAVVALDDPVDETAQRSLAAALAAPGGIDLVYERYALGRTLGSDLCAARNVPHVLEVNAPLADEERRWRGGSVDPALDARERRVFSRARVVLAVSRAVAEYALARGADPERVMVRPNAVDAARFQPRRVRDPLREQLVPGGCFALGFHGRLRPWHGLERLGQAATALLARGLPVHLVLVGEGDFEEALGPQVPREVVTRVPWVPHEAVPAYVATFDALPLTYAPTGPCYFSPLKLAEAMACGVVPIFPPLGDLPELLTDGVDALSYPAGDALGLADAVERLVREPELLASLGAAATRSAGTRSWRAIAEDVVAAVEGSGARRVRTANGGSRT